MKEARRASELDGGIAHQLSLHSLSPFVVRTVYPVNSLVTAVGEVTWRILMNGMSLTKPTKITWLYGEAAPLSFSPTSTLIQD